MQVHEKFMEEALLEAQKAFQKKEVPIGAIVVEADRIIGRGHNLVESIQDPIAHAEILAINSAATAQASWRLNECTLYVTVEPCPMCAGAILLSRISTVVFGASDPRLGACGSVFHVLPSAVLNSEVQIISGICEERCKNLLQAFFQDLRKEKT